MSVFWRNLHTYDGKRVDKIIALEQSVDRYEDALGTYLVKLNNCDLSQNDSRTLSILLHCIGNFERISDHAVNITDSLTEMKEKDLYRFCGSGSGKSPSHRAF